MKLAACLAVIAALSNISKAFHYPTPQNGQVGALNFPVQCAAYGIVPVTIDLFFSATAPLTAQSGQQIYYADVNAKVTIPQQLIQLAGVIGAYSANTQIFLDLDLSNANPPVFTAFPNGYWVNNTVLNPNGSTMILLPKSGVLPPIGPVTMQTAGVSHNIQLGTVKANVYLYNKAGAQIFGPLVVNCGAQSPQILIAAVNVLPQIDASPAPLLLSNGFAPAFPAVGSGLQYGCFDFQYDCNIGNKGSYPFEGIACGGLATYYGTNSRFNLVNATIDLIATQSTVRSIKSAYPGSSALILSVKYFTLNEQGVFAAPPVNAVPNGYTVSTSIPSSGPLTISIPSSGKLEVGPFIAAPQQNQIFYISVGDSLSHLSLKDSFGRSTGEADVTCSPRIKNIIIVGIQTYNKFILFG